MRLRLCALCGFKNGNHNALSEKCTKSWFNATPPLRPLWFQKWKPQRKKEKYSHKSRLKRLPLRALRGFKKRNHK